MNAIRLVKKSVFNVTIAALSAAFFVLLVGFISLVIKDTQSQTEIAALKLEREFNKKQIQNLSQMLEVSLKETAIAQEKFLNAKAKLDTALIPEATVSQAFGNHISKPISETFSAMWTAVADTSKKTFNYVFK